MGASMIVKLNGKLIQPKATFKKKEEFRADILRDWGNVILEGTRTPEWTISYDTAMAIDTTTGSVGENERWVSVSAHTDGAWTTARSRYDR